MISSVPRKYRAFGNSTAQIFLNLLGFLPSPFLYGLICELTGGRDSRWGMVLIMFWSIVGLGTISIAYFYDKNKRKRKADNDQIVLNIIHDENDKQNKKNPNETLVQREMVKSNSVCLQKLEGKFDGKMFGQSLENKGCGFGDRKESSLGNGSMQRSILSSLDLSQIGFFQSRKHSKNSISNDLFVLTIPEK